MWKPRRFLAANFTFASSPGFATSKNATDHAYRPLPERDENAQAARFANLLYQYTGDTGDQKTARRAMRYLATPEVATARLSAPILLSEAQFTQPAVHITIVGSKQDQAARGLFATASADAPLYRWLEWWDRSEEPLPRADIEYPSLPKAGAFLCTASACSSPITDVTAFEKRLRAVRSPVQ